MQLRGKTVLITGGRRVGSELALLLADRGANVAMSWFTSREAIEATVAEVRARGVKGLAIPADLRRPAEAEAFVETAVRELGAVHVLINMASVFYATPFDTLTPDDFDRNISSNLTAPFLVALSASRAMRQNPAEDGVQGKIVNFVDWAVDRPYRDFLPYLVAKGGLVTLTKALAVELAPTIAVNAIAPAMIDPPPLLSEQAIDEIRRQTPLQRIGCPADANNLVLYLLEGTDFTTGNVYRVDGGRFLGKD